MLAGRNPPSAGVARRSRLERARPHHAAAQPAAERQSRIICARGPRLTTQQRPCSTSPTAIRWRCRCWPNLLQRDHARDLSPRTRARRRPRLLERFVDARSQSSALARTGRVRARARDHRGAAERYHRPATGRQLFTWLRDLPFIEHGPRGVFPHDLAREVLDADLRWRDPLTLSRAARAHSRMFTSRDYAPDRALSSSLRTSTCCTWRATASSAGLLRLGFVRPHVRGGGRGGRPRHDRRGDAQARRRRLRADRRVLAAAPTPGVRRLSRGRPSRSQASPPHCSWRNRSRRTWPTTPRSPRSGSSSRGRFRCGTASASCTTASSSAATATRTWSSTTWSAWWRRMRWLTTPRLAWSFPVVAEAPRWSRCSRHPLSLGHLKPTSRSAGVGTPSSPTIGAIDPIERWIEVKDGARSERRGDPRWRTPPLEVLSRAGFRGRGAAGAARPASARARQ